MIAVTLVRSNLEKAPSEEETLIASFGYQHEIGENLWIGQWPYEADELKRFKAIVSVAGLPNYPIWKGQFYFSTHFEDIGVLPDPLYLHGLADMVNTFRKLGPTLVHCQAGLNRSGLICGLALVKSGVKPAEAIAHMRAIRSREVLYNNTFREWLLTQG